jgi:signal recognition particle GTPase
VERRRLNNHNSCVLWFAGLPSSGKSTIAGEAEHHLNTRGIRTYLLDGDNVRPGKIGGRVLHALGQVVLARLPGVEAFGLYGR